LAMLRIIVLTLPYLALIGAALEVCEQFGLI
jgi:hypothetical protein